MSLNASDPEFRSLILFDGVCNLCNGFVNFVIDRDPHAVFGFGTLQSDEAQFLLRRFHVEASKPTTIFLLEDGKLYRQSAAVLRIARRLNGLWPLLYGFVVIPRPLRDGVYRLIANNRYRWFGRRNRCRIPTPDLRRRFLSSDRAPTPSISRSTPPSPTHPPLQ